MEGKDGNSLISKDRLQAFSESFVSFTEMTRQLQEAYRELEQRYETLNKKLSETNIELRQSLAEKDRLSSYLNDILENLNSGVVVIDTKGVVRLFNRAAERILKYNNDNVIGRKWGDIIDSPNTPSGCLETLTKGAVFTEEEKVVADGEGGLINIGFSTSLLKSPDGEVIGAVEVFYDLTKMKNLEREMTRVSTLAALGRMAATIAHEVRNPLGAIAGFAALLDKDTPKDDDRKKLIAKITTGIGRLNRIVNGLLDFTREPNLNITDVDLESVISEVIEEIAARNNKRGIIIESKINASLGKYPLDKESFRLVMNNLIDNAIQASPEGEKVKVILSRKGSQVRVEVIDKGKGITEDVINRIFDPFFTTREKGTGLGLPVVKKLIKAHNGTIFAESGGINKGARFVICLPLLNPEHPDYNKE